MWTEIAKKEPPNDGTPFIAYDPKEEARDQIVILYYSESRMKSLGNPYEELHASRHYTWKPTHWKKRPKPPKVIND